MRTETAAVDGFDGREASDDQRQVSAVRTGSTGRSRRVFPWCESARRDYGIVALVSRTGWTAKTGVGRYLRHRYPHYDQLRQRPSGAADSSVDRIQDAVILVDGPGPRPVAGGAFHQRIGLLYQDVDLARSGASSGRRRALGGGGSRPDPIWDCLCRRTLDLARQLRGARVDVTDVEEIELAQLCAVLTLYEQVDVSRRELPITTARASAPVKELLTWVRDDDVRDVVAMTALYADHFPRNLATEPVVVEPNMHPGWADLLLGGLLLELKTSASAQISDEFAYTLLGHLLLTSDDFPTPGVPVTHVGWYFARHALPWVFQVDDFLTLMAGTNVTLAEARSEFDQLLSFPEDTPEWMITLMKTPVTRARLSRPGRAGPP